MTPWHRVFGTNDDPVDPDALLAHLHGAGYAATGAFRGDEQGWFTAELTLGGAVRHCDLQRYLATEEGIRDELNAWAAGIELIDTPHQAALMQHMISTRQLFTVRGDDGALCREVGRWLAVQTDGIFQIDGEGYFSAAGERLAPDEA
jgi:hypothetical protein